MNASAPLTEIERAHFLEVMEKGFEKHPVPENVKDELMRYILYGVSMGGFLEAVVTNKLMETYARMPLDGHLWILNLVKIVYNCIPNESWGTSNRMHRWMHKVRGVG